MSPAEHGDALLSPEANRRMFDAIADRYDLLNRVLSLGLDRHWRQQAVRRLEPTTSATYLDAGCGTGDLCEAILLEAPGCRTIGIDSSQSMLTAAREKLQKAGWAGQADFAPGDITALTFEDGCFDGVVSAFCIRNVCDRRAAFREIKRVLKPGGRLVFLELTRPTNPLVRAGHCVYNRCVVPLVGALISRGRAYRYLAASIEKFVKPEELVQELTDAGLANAQALPLSGGVVTLFSCVG